MASKKGRSRGASSQHQQGRNYPESCFFVDPDKVQTGSLIKPANYNQRQYVQSMRQNVISIAHGCAGTGKSLLALFTGVQLMNSEDSPIQKIFYLRSNVGMSEEKGLGFLPGGMNEKILPLAYPVLDNLIQFTSEGHAKYLIEKGRIEVLPVAMVRGRSFANAFVICDEVQNCSPHMVKTLLTRVSEGSKIVLIGDSKQVDLQSNIQSGLMDAVRKLQGLPSVGIVEFQRSDIQRHPILADVLARYEDAA